MTVFCYVARLHVTPDLMVVKWSFNIPTISSFFDITIRMWRDDHPPMHIHAEYQGFEALIEVETGLIREGELPRKVAGIVKDWCAAHQSALLDNWQRAQNFEPLNKIQGADRD